jgi:thiamine biosynthesis protein ThiS
MLRIVVNGKLEDLSGPLTISQFLAAKGVSRTALVERNLEIVKRDSYDELQLQDGDELEIVQMMAGG